MFNSRKSIIILFILFCATSLNAGPLDEYWFASGVVAYNPGPGEWVNNPQYNNPARCLGAPKGFLVSVPDNSSIATLGDGGSITLSFKDPVQNDPGNPFGLDFIVFSNAFFVGGWPTTRCQELAFVEISQDGNTWYLILPSILPANLRGGIDTGNSSTIVRGYAEYTPTVGLPQVLNPASPVSRTVYEYYTIPDRQSVAGNELLIDLDYVSGGGDAFDIEDAVVQTAPGVPALDSNGKPIPAGISWFKYIRITDAKVGDKWPHGGEISAEIDAVARVRPAMTLGQIRNLSSGGYGYTTDAIVTMILEDGFMVESSDRSAALKLVTNDTYEVGDKITFSGHLTKIEGRYEIRDPMIALISSGNPIPAPLGLSPKSLHTEMAYGLRVRTWGKVTDPGDGYYCVITDGSHSVKAVWNTYRSVALNDYISVTGICDREEVTRSTIVRVADESNDIVVYGN